MSKGQDALKDFEKFSEEEKKRVESFAKSQRNEQASEWYADKDLQFKRESMQKFFTSIGDTRVGGNEVVCVKRAADTVAALDRAYKFRIQSRLDNVPRQDAQLEMEKLYWDQLHKALDHRAIR